MKKLFSALLCLFLLVLPFSALAEGLEIESEPDIFVEAGEGEAISEAFESYVEEIQFDLLGEESSQEDMIERDQSVMAEEEEFIIDENGVLLWYNGVGGDVVIPDTVKEIRGGNTWYLGRRIDNVAGHTGAFEGSNISSITIPDSVVSIGNWAFGGCSKLTSVVIPDSVTAIGNEVFRGCNNLSSVKLSNNIKSISDGLFLDCSNLSEIMIPAGISGIGANAFQNCSSLVSITISDGITNIGNSAFENCNSLTSIAIPSSVIGIGDYAFYGCSGLSDVTLAKGINSIGKFAFKGCTKLSSIVVPEGITGIGESTFSQCSGLVSVSLPDSLTTIGSSVFNECGKLVKNQYSSKCGQHWRGGLLRLFEPYSSNCPVRCGIHRHWNI